MAATITTKAAFPSKIVVAAGTYDGVIAGWELHERDKKFAIRFASPVHGGSIRSLALATKKETPLPSRTSKSKKSNKAEDDDNDNDNTAANNSNLGSLLLSCGYDETLQTHDIMNKRLQSGQVRTPSDFGTPICSSFAPPAGQQNKNATHCLVGFTSGKLLIYRKRDWSVQHVLAGHDGGVASLAVHPSALLAVTGGNGDGKLKLWDLATGRLAHVDKIRPAATTLQGRTHYDPVVCIVWLTTTTTEHTITSQEEKEEEEQSQQQQEVYGFCYGSHITVRSVETGRDLLDVEMPSRVNQICLLSGSRGVFVAAACNDGSLPVIAVPSLDDNNDNINSGQEEECRAIMAIEPVDSGPTAGEERFKCVQAVCSPGYLVATANSAGVVSLMDLQGAVNMIVNGTDDDECGSKGGDDEEEKPVHSDSDVGDDDDASSNDDEGRDNDTGNNKDDGGEEDVELAVDLIDSIQLGTGARITCLAAWSTVSDSASDTEDTTGMEEKKSAEEEPTGQQKIKRKRDDNSNHNSSSSKEVVVMDSDALDKARDLVAKAKKIQKRKQRKKHRHHNNNNNR